MAGMKEVSQAQDWIDGARGLPHRYRGYLDDLGSATSAGGDEKHIFVDFPLLDPGAPDLGTERNELQYRFPSLIEKPFDLQDGSGRSGGGPEAFFKSHETTEPLNDDLEPSLGEAAQEIQQALLQMCFVGRPRPEASQEAELQQLL